jgi:hypothetical protein
MMILYAICCLMCATDLWAHIRFCIPFCPFFGNHPILSLKFGVIIILLLQTQIQGIIHRKVLFDANLRKGTRETPINLVQTGQRTTVL